MQACVLHEKLSDYVRRTRLAAVKILMIHTPETTAKLLGKMREKHGREFYICTSKPYFLEILQKDVSKAAGIRKVAELYGLTMADVMAVGDSDNDISMIREAALGAAVANAAPELKAIADLVTLSNDEDAVAHLIRLNLENKL